MHRYSLLFEEITVPAFPEGWYYATIPTLNLTTHGKGLEGARAAAVDLVQLWLSEKLANGEENPEEHTVYFAQVEIPDALQII